MPSRELESTVTAVRIRTANSAAVRDAGDYVLYWMIAQRRSRFSFALQRAAEWARHLGKPLLVFEALRCGYRWASDRMHRFVLDGMVDQEARFALAEVAYYPYVEPSPGDGKGLLEALASRAAVVVTDDFPCFFLPRMVEAAARRLPVRLEQVDGNGLLPMRAAPKVFLRAVDFRRFLQRDLGNHLLELPEEEPLAGLPRDRVDLSPIAARWPAADLSRRSQLIADLPIDHGVPAVAYRGGQQQAGQRLEQFLRRCLPRYAAERNAVRERATSGLSPYLHFGHISAHEIFLRLAEQEDWDPACLGTRASGARRGWWGMGEAAESFLDELVTWRELGYNMAWQRQDLDRYESLPAWARATLEEHAADPRPHLYGIEELEAAATHDELWNAAQRELLRDGRIHNYLRMLWGKKVLEWSPHPRDAVQILIELNNKYAVDGRNPNSYSGIFWCFGRYDRAWGPERPIFGKVRYMSSESTRRKLDAKAYMAQYAAGRQGELEFG